MEESQDVLDVEVVETEVVETIEDHEECNMDIEAFNELVDQTYTKFEEQNYQFDMHIEADLHKLLTCTVRDEEFDPSDCLKDELTSASYLKVMHMVTMKCQSEDKKNAERYCSLRMMEILKLQEGKKGKRPAYLSFTEFKAPQELRDVIEKNTSFLAKVVGDINKRLMLMNVVIFLALVAFLYIFLKLSILLALVEALILGFINYLLNSRRLPKMFLRKQLDVLIPYVEEDVLEFDRPVRYS